MKDKEFDRVRSSTCDRDNLRIDRKIINGLKDYAGKSQKEITKRIVQIEKEWSIERWLELNASTLAFIGVILGAFVNIYWLFLPGIVLPFLALHALQGWCPPVPLMRRLNIRTRREMDWEKFTLKFLRGDFDKITQTKTVEEILELVKKDV